MIYEALLVLDLPCSTTPPLPTPLMEGLENLLFTGRWARRRACCSMSPAVVLARCLRVLRERGYSGLRVQDDAGTVLNQAVIAELDDPGDPHWPEAIPQRWAEQPCELEIQGLVRAGGAVATLTLRHTPRHALEHSALSGTLRALWDVGPEPGREASFVQSFRAALADDSALAELTRRLRLRGETLSDEMVEGLAKAFAPATGNHWGRVLALHGFSTQPERFAPLLAGLPEDRRHQLALLEGRLAQSHARWPAVDPEGVSGQLRRGVFVPSAEVHRVA